MRHNALCIGLVSCVALADSPPPDVYALGLEAVAFASDAGSMTWPGMAALDRSFVVIDGEREIAVCRDAAPGFEPLPDSPLPGCRAFARPRVFPPRMQASLNIFGAEETVLVSSPEVLGQGELEWKILFVHERFHQWQSTQPNYRERIEGLGLSGGDRTGMWMLTYAFPYDEPAVATDFAGLGLLLHAALTADSEPDAADAAARYVRARHDVMARLSPLDRRYAEFQLWKEGAARYTEIAVARSAARTDRPDADAWHALAEATYARELDSLSQLRLPVLRRGAFYTLGALEWLLADNLSTGWRDAYATGPLAVGPYLAPGRAR